MAERKADMNTLRVGQPGSATNRAAEVVPNEQTVKVDDGTRSLPAHANWNRFSLITRACGCSWDKTGHIIRRET
jgi:hypothetical protein